MTGALAMFVLSLVVLHLARRVVRLEAAIVLRANKDGELEERRMIPKPVKPISKADQAANTLRGLEGP